MNGKMPGELRSVERLRKKYFHSKELIFKTDYGKGAGEGYSSTYPVSLKHIARTSLTPRNHALRLFHIARYIHAENILEMGTSLGFTTAYLAFANKDARVVSIEGCPELSKIATSNLASLGIRNAEVLSGRFEDKLMEALAMLGKIDLLFIDGNHRKEAVLANFEGCLPGLHNGSVVILDDIHANPGMEEAWRILCSRADVTISLDFYHSGWLFFRKESSKEHFRLRYL
jgi:predicted O-methyltransferase YrrM